MTTVISGRLEERWAVEIGNKQGVAVVRHLLICSYVNMFNVFAVCLIQLASNLQGIYSVTARGRVVGGRFL